MSDPVVTGCGIPVFGVKTCQNQKTVYYNAEQSLSCPAGFAAHTYTAAAGKFHSLLSQADADAQATVYLTDLIVGRCVPMIPVVTSETISVAPSGAVNYQILATNSPTSYASAPLPAGLTLDPVTGIITGNIPATITTYSIPISATNGAGTGNGILTLSVVVPYQFTVFSPSTPHFTKQIAVDGGAYAPAVNGQTYSFFSGIKIKTTTAGTFSPSAGSELWSIAKSGGSAALPILAAGSQASATVAGSVVRAMNGYQNVGGGGEYYPIDTDLVGLPYSGTVSLVGVNLNTTTSSPPPNIIHYATGGGTFNSFSMETILNF